MNDANDSKSGILDISSDSLIQEKSILAEKYVEKGNYHLLFFFQNHQFSIMKRMFSEDFISSDGKSVLSKIQSLRQKFETSRKLEPSESINRLTDISFDLEIPRSSEISSNLEAEMAKNKFCEEKIVDLQRKILKLEEDNYQIISNVKVIINMI